MDEEIAAMKVNKQISPPQEENKGLFKYIKTKSRSPNEADLNKWRSLKNRGTMKLNINLNTPLTAANRIFNEQNAKSLC